MTGSILIGETSKNAREIYRFQLTEYQGHRLFDLRIYAKNKNGEYVATPKGISIQADRIELVGELILQGKKLLPLEN
ncbi:PC4/YdbC family ssDNA-binding protein [Pseudaquidulcibacter saccharophilus]|uniref:PC4/YdbC family ssDNA-binding protein n=1 Tax=Pseudaquidulcibacter saccharophilus TaxID=2831900 RepID=UPI001EFF3451|nr:PC4/YdbC family ssDNA-binding protein [Pseudaquidulcibacter saccharophilus]